MEKKDEANVSVYSVQSSVSSTIANSYSKLKDKLSRGKQSAEVENNANKLQNRADKENDARKEADAKKLDKEKAIRTTAIADYLSIR